MVSRHKEAFDAIFAWKYAKAELVGIALPNGPLQEVQVTVATDRKRGSCRIAPGATPTAVWAQMDALAKSLHGSAGKTKKRVNPSVTSNERIS